MRSGIISAAAWSSSTPSAIPPTTYHASPRKYDKGLGEHVIREPSAASISRPAAPTQPGGGRRAGPSARCRRSDRPDGREPQIVVDDPLGPAWVRQDDDRP